MAKKDEKTRKHETGKEETHSKKPDGIKKLDSSKAGGQGKVKSYETDLENGISNGKGMKNEGGFENKNKLDDGINVPTGLGNTDGFGFSNPDVSGQLGKTAAGKGCLSAVIGAILVIALLIIL
jgi:hypothetical protein